MNFRSRSIGGFEKNSRPIRPLGSDGAASGGHPLRTTPGRASPVFPLDRTRVLLLAVLQRIPVRQTLAGERFAGVSPPHSIVSVAFQGTQVPDAGRQTKRFLAMGAKQAPGPGRPIEAALDRGLTRSGRALRWPAPQGGSHGSASWRYAGSMRTARVCRTGPFTASSRSLRHPFCFRYVSGASRPSLSTQRLINELAIRLQRPRPRRKVGCWHRLQRPH